MTSAPFDPSQHDLGYLLTAYADGQLAPEGVRWVEQQLGERAELRLRLDEIRALQQQLRSGLAGLELPLALDEPRRASVLAAAGRGPVAKRRIALRFHLPTIVGLAAACLAVVVVFEGAQPLRMSASKAREQSRAAELRNREELADADLALHKETAPSGFAAPAEAYDLAVAPSSTVDSVQRVIREDEKASAYGALAGKRGRDQAPADKLGDRGLVGGDARSEEKSEADQEQPLNGLASSWKATGPTRLKRDQDKELAGQAGAPGANGAQAAGEPLATGGRADVQLKGLALAEGKGDRAYATVNAPQAKRADGGGEAAGIAAAKPASPPAPVVATPPPGASRGAEALAANGKPAERKLAEAAPRQPAAAPAAAAPRPMPALQPAKSQAAGLELAQREREPEEAGRQTPADGERLSMAKAREELRAKDGKERLAGEGRDGQALQAAKQAQDATTTSTVETDGLGRPVELAKAKAASADATPRDEAKKHEFDSALAERQQAQQQGLAQQQGKDGRFYFRQSHWAEVDARRAAPSTRQAANERAPHDAATNRALLGEELNTVAIGDALSLLGTVAGDADVSVAQSGLPQLQATLVRLQARNLNRGQAVLQVARGAGLQVLPLDGTLELDRPRGQLDPTASFGYEREAFRALFGSAPMVATADDARSTFALDAETASYDRARAQLAAGQPVDPGAIRPEQFINAMPMDYPAATGSEAFTLYAEAAPAPFAASGEQARPWSARTALVAIGVVARPAGADERRPLHLTLAIDCSGSMGREGGLARVQAGLAELVSHLRADDSVALVAFSDQARLVLPATPGSERARIAATIAGLTADGATNAVDGLGLAYQVAAEGVAPGAESRVVLASDGATLAGPGDLVETVLARVRAHRERGVSLLVVGSGAGSYQAAALERLANRADGQQVFLASDEDAKRIFAGRLLPERLGVLAKDAKVQVTWNPQRVSHARLIGYEQRRLAHTDFRNDAVDAGELSHDAQVTALYEVLLVDGATGPLGSAAVRYHDTRLQQVRELACALPGTVLRSQASERLRLLACAAETAEWLQRGWWSNVRLPAPERILAELARCPQPAARELEDVVRRAQAQNGGKP